MEKYDFAKKNDLGSVAAVPVVTRVTDLKEELDFKKQSLKNYLKNNDSIDEEYVKELNKEIQFASSNIRAVYFIDLKTKLYGNKYIDNFSKNSSVIDKTCNKFEFMTRYESVKFNFTVFNALCSINPIITFENKYIVKKLKDNHSDFFEKFSDDHVNFYPTDAFRKFFLTNYRKEHDYERNKLTSINYIDYSNFRKEIIEILVDAQLREADRKSKISEEIASFIRIQRIVCTIRGDKNKEVWTYKEGIYIPEGISYIEEDCRFILGAAYKDDIVKMVVNKIQAETQISSEEFFKDEDTNLIPVLNGIYNIKKDTLEPFSSAYKFFSKIPITYNKNAQCDAVKGFLSDIFKNADDVKIAQEMFGWVLRRDYNLQYSVMLLGDGGNGKGKFLDLLKRFIGSVNITAIPVQDFATDKYSIAGLYGKLANISGDIPPTALKNDGQFKSATGGDELRGPRKYLKDITFVSYAKQIFAANELPKTYDITRGFFRRWLILECPFRFCDADELKDFKAKGIKNVKLKDTEIIDKISSDEEFSGLFNFALAGLRRILKNKSFSTCGSVDSIKEKWMRSSNSLFAFCEDAIEKDSDKYVLKEDFQVAYNNYCNEHGLKIEGSKFSHQYLTRDMSAVESRPFIDGEKKRIWKGIGFKKGFKVENNDEENFGNQRTLNGDPMLEVPLAKEFKY